MARARTTSIVLLHLLASIAVDGRDLLAQAHPGLSHLADLDESRSSRCPWRRRYAAADRLFLALQSGVSAHRLTDGSEIWQNARKSTGAMAASDDRLVVSVKGELQALDASTGAVVWSDQAGPLTAPPLVSGEWLLVASGESIICYRVADGTKVWSAPTPARSSSALAVSGDRAYIPAADGRMIALELEVR